MLYKFKSQATGDVIMLEPNGRRVLEIIGKEPSAQGIVLPAQMADAIAALRQAIEQEESEQKAAIEEARAKGEPTPRFDAVSLRQRATPFIDMLTRCAREDKEIVWGV